MEYNIFSKLYGNTSTSPTSIPSVSQTPYRATNTNNFTEESTLFDHIFNVNNTTGINYDERVGQTLPLPANENTNIDNENSRTLFEELFEYDYDRKKMENLKQNLNSHTLYDENSQWQESDKKKTRTDDQKNSTSNSNSRPLTVQPPLTFKQHYPSEGIEGEIPKLIEQQKKITESLMNKKIGQDPSTKNDVKPVNILETSTQNKNELANNQKNNNSNKIGPKKSAVNNITNLKNFTYAKSPNKTNYFNNYGKKTTPDLKNLPISNSQIGLKTTDISNERNPISIQNASLKNNNNNQSNQIGEKLEDVSTLSFDNYKMSQIPTLNSPISAVNKSVESNSENDFKETSQNISESNFKRLNISSKEPVREFQETSYEKFHSKRPKSISVATNTDDLDYVEKKTHKKVEKIAAEMETKSEKLDDYKKTKKRILIAVTAIGFTLFALLIIGLITGLAINLSSGNNNGTAVTNVYVYTVAAKKQNILFNISTTSAKNLIKSTTNSTQI